MDNETRPSGNDRARSRGGLVLSGGLALQPLVLVAGAAGEHLVGHLVGEHLPGEKPPTWLELVLSGLPNGQEAGFRWELSGE